MLHFDTVERGLKELNNEINMGLVEKRPSDWTHMFVPAKGKEDIRKGRTSVYWRNKYVCAIDLGAIPEIKVYGVEDGYVSIPMSDIHRYDDTKVSFMEILPSSPYYHLALTKAERGDDNYCTNNGKVYLYEALRWNKVRGKVQKLGWRHTFEALLRKKIPGVTRRSLSKKFNVDMLRYPTGPREEIHDALFAE